MSTGRNIEVRKTSEYYKALSNLVLAVRVKKTLEHESNQTHLMVKQSEVQLDNMNKIIEIEKKNCYDILDSFEDIQTKSHSNLQMMVFCYKASLWNRSFSIKDRYDSQMLKEALIYRRRFLIENSEFDNYFFIVIDEALRKYDESMIRRDDLVDLIVFYGDKYKKIQTKLFHAEQRLVWSMEKVMSIYS